MTAPLQHGQAAQLIGLQAAGTRGMDRRKARSGLRCTGATAGSDLLTSYGFNLITSIIRSGRSPDDENPS
jgi:hypothetical protein